MTTRITNDMLIASTLADINSAQAAMDRSQSELSSGKSLLEPSDDPVGASQQIALQSTLDGLTTYENGANDGVAWLQTASATLSNVGEVTQRVRELVLQAANGVENQSDLDDIAEEIKQLTESIKQDGNVQYAGQYVFSGTATNIPPYTQGENDAYGGNTEAVSRTVGPGVSVQVNAPLSSVLGEGQPAADGKLLDTLRTIVENLHEGTPAALQAVGGKDLTSLDTNLGALTSLQANVGAAIDQLKTAENRIQSLRSTTAAQLSDVEDANFAQVSIEFSNQQAAYDAALRAGASIVQEKSLLEFLG